MINHKHGNRRCIGCTHDGPDCLCSKVLGEKCREYCSSTLEVDSFDMSIERGEILDYCVDECKGVLGYTEMLSSYEHLYPDPFHVIENIISSSIWKPFIAFIKHHKCLEILRRILSSKKIKLGQYITKDTTDKNNIVYHIKHQMSGKDGSMFLRKFSKVFASI